MTLPPNIKRIWAYLWRAGICILIMSFLSAVVGHLEWSTWFFDDFFWGMAAGMVYMGWTEKMVRRPV